MHLVVGDDPNDVADQPEIIDQILDGSLPEADDTYMADLPAAEMLLSGAETFGRLVDASDHDRRLPASVPAARRERTARAFAAALLLSVLGVDEETILAAITSSRTSTDRTERIEVLRPTLEAAGVDVEKMRQFLSAQRAGDGGDPCGTCATTTADRALPPRRGRRRTETLDRLRDLLLE